MKIDYKAIQERLKARDEIASVLSNQIHPWEAGYKRDFKNDRHDYHYIRNLIRLHDIHWRLTVNIQTPVAWKGVNPLSLFTGIVRREISLSGAFLHGKLCSKCEALRAMRRKAPKKRILPEESD